MYFTLVETYSYKPLKIPRRDLFLPDLDSSSFDNDLIHAWWLLSCFFQKWPL